MWSHVYGTSMLQRCKESSHLKSLGYKKCILVAEWDNYCINAEWIAKKYEDDLRMNPTWGLDQFHTKVVKDLDIGVSRSLAYRATKRTIKNIEGSAEEEC